MEKNSKAIHQLIPIIVNIFKDTVVSIILYGSAARQTDTEESDVDIAVIIKSYTEGMHDSLTDAVVDLQLEYNKVFSVLLIDYEKYKEWEDIMPFYKNLKKEGICLWPAA